MNQLNLALIISAFILASGTAVFAQETPFDRVKQDIKELLDENTRLEEEYKELRSRVLSVQDDINTYKLENRALEDEVERARSMAEKQRYTQDSLAHKIALLRKEIAGNEKQSRALEAELTTFDGKLQTWKAKISDLEDQKNLLKSHIREEEAAREKVMKGEAEEIQALQGQLEALQGEEQNVKQAIETSRRENQKAMEEIEVLKNENDDLENQIADLQREKEMKIRENAALQRRVDDDRMSSDYAKKLQEKRAVETRIKHLEGELERVRRTLESSVGLQAQKRELVDQIMTVDKKNQELRKKVSELKAAIEAAKSGS